MDSLERSNLTIAYDPALIIISTAKRAFLRAERLRRVGESFNLLGVWKSSSVPGPLKTPHRLASLKATYWLARAEALTRKACLFNDFYVFFAPLILSKVC